MKRFYPALCAFLAVCTLFVLIRILPGTAAAAGTTVYLDASAGSDAASGERSAPKKTLNAAIEALGGADGEIRLLSDTSVTGEFDEADHAGRITLSSEEGAALVLAASSVYRMNGETVFGDLTVRAGSKAVIAAQFYPVTFGEGVNIQNGAQNLFVNGGYEKPSGTHPTDRDAHITIHGGDFYAVCGFTRTKGAASTYYSGTAYLTVTGGTVALLYGGPLYNHAGGSADISVTGGTVNTLYTAGDVTRKLSGSATLRFAGGTVRTIRVNNVIGNVRAVFSGTAFDRVLVEYASDALKSESEKNRSYKTAEYDASLYDEAHIRQIVSAFDETKNLSRLRVSPDGSVRTLEEGFRLLSPADGELIVAGTTSLSSCTLKETEVPVTVRGEEGAKLILERGAVVEIPSSLTLENLTVSAPEGATLRLRSSFTAAESVTTEGDLAIVIEPEESSAVILSGGRYASVSVSGQAVFACAGSEVASVTAENAPDAVIDVADGRIGSLNLNGQTALRCFGGEIGTLTASGTLVMYRDKTVIGGAALTLSADSRLLLADRAGGGEELRVSFPRTEERTFCYLADSGKGDGSSPYAPLSSLKSAVAALPDGGKVVLCGDYTHNELRMGEHAFPVTITANDGFTDYGARLELQTSFIAGGDTLFEFLTITAPKADLRIYGAGHSLTVGENVSTELIDANTSWPNLCGGSPNAAELGGKISVTVCSGEWGWLTGGSIVTDTNLPQNGGEIEITINGGIFHKYVTLSAARFVRGSAKLTVNGGTLYGGIFGLRETSAAITDIFNWDFDVTVNGGQIWFEISPAYLRTTRQNGSWKVTLNGGDFSHLTDLNGSEKFAGKLTSELVVSDGVDLTREESGEIAFANPLREGADPWMFYYGGFYWYAATGGVLHKLANPSDLAYSAGHQILFPKANTDYSRKMWSPEIHYFTEEEAGEGNGGWYLFIAADNGADTAEFISAFVYKCLDGDDLLGRWGHPETGEANVPARMSNADDPTINAGTTLFGGMSVLKVNGKAYITYVSEEGRGTKDFYQTINISRFLTPWKLCGEPTVICVPEYDWERGGYGYSAAKGTWYPAVVEGSTAVYGDNGEIFVIYSGSGYWTTKYCLAQLTLTGDDPMIAANWEKEKKPFFTLSSEVNGCGHASYFTDHEGTRWVCYHAYIGSDTSSGRFAFLEPYTIRDGKMVVGNGSGHPNALSTSYTVSLNPKPLADKISGFGKTSVSASPQTPEDTTGNVPAVPDPSEPSYLIWYIFFGLLIAAAVAVILFTIRKPKQKS
ncbi:MAG: family 43 glycosylhydrolase [Clostridia bacterium]|nr:family 43 glycosylhydrolase [Clostridia bacterium]